MTIGQMLEMALKPEPAKIKAETKKDGQLSIKFEGRGLELMALSLSISESIIKDSKGAITVDDYCHMLKDIFRQHSKSKEQRDVENEIMKKIIESVFK